MGVLTLFELAKRVKDIAPAKSKRVVTSVSLTPEQAQFVKDNDIVLSVLVRGIIESGMREQKTQDMAKSSTGE